MHHLGVYFYTPVEKKYCSILLVFTLIENWDVETRNRYMGLTFSTWTHSFPKYNCLAIEVPSDIWCSAYVCHVINIIWPPDPQDSTSMWQELCGCTQATLWWTQPFCHLWCYLQAHIPVSQCIQDQHVFILISDYYLWRNMVPYSL